MANVLISILWGLAVWRISRAGSGLSGTTLTPAYRWSLGAAAAWTLAWGGECFPQQASPALRDLVWWLATLLVLCPPLAVLGARRPGVQAWSWFVLWPLLAVLGWPAVLGVLQSTAAGAIRIPLPLMIGFALVLLMGLGNYAPTRYGLSAALAGIAACCVAAPLSEAAPPLPVTPDALRRAAVTALALAVLLADRQARLPSAASTPLVRLWTDFRNTFGVVWARRIADRINHRAASENWTWRLGDDGFHPLDPAAPDSAGATPECDPRIEQALRWQLDRHVTADWIDRRLRADAQPPRCDNSV